MGPVGIPETSVLDYQSTLRDILEERRPRSHHTGKPEGETPEDFSLKAVRHEYGGRNVI